MRQLLHPRLNNPFETVFPSFVWSFHKANPNSALKTVGLWSSWPDLCLLQRRANTQRRWQHGLSARGLVPQRTALESTPSPLTFLYVVKCEAWLLSASSSVFLDTPLERNLGVPFDLFCLHCLLHSQFQSPPKNFLMLRVYLFSYLILSDFSVYLGYSVTLHAHPPIWLKMTPFFIP